MIDPFLIFDVDPDCAVPDFDRIGGNSHLGQVLADAILELKLPLVPGTRDNAICHNALVERAAAMGADIVDGQDPFLIAEKADLSFAEFDAAAFADGDFFQFEGSVDVGHVQ